MKVEVKKVANGKSKANKDYQAVMAVVIESDCTDDYGMPISFLASANQYNKGDVVDLFVTIDYNYHAKVAHCLA